LNEKPKLDDKIAAFLDRVFDVYIKNHPTSRIAAEECKMVGLEIGVYESPPSTELPEVKSEE
jgi:hypothetical protein